MILPFEKLAMSALAMAAVGAGILMPGRATSQTLVRVGPAPLHKDPAPATSGNGRPALVATKDLAGFKELPAGRQELIENAIAVARDSPWLPYLYGGADPSRGGLDCSGAMYYVMNQTGLSPPRTSAGQFQWLRDHNRLHSVPDDALTTNHPSLAWLRPGDLLFWASGHAADAAESPNITHVAMYLGRETTDGWQIMINATDGRSYRGTKANGYGVYDFRMPREASLIKIAGYGSPPGMPEIPSPAAPAPARQPSRSPAPTRN